LLNRDTLVDHLIVVDHVVVVDDGRVLIHVSSGFQLDSMPSNMILPKVPLGHKSIMGMPQTKPESDRNPIALISETDAAMIVSSRW